MNIQSGLSSVEAKNLNVMSVGEVLRKINAIAMRRNGVGLIGVDAELWPENFEIWSAAQPLTPPREIYSVTELMQLDDADFVNNAYRVLLRRAPDPAGQFNNTEALRNGSQTKLSILATMRFSPEGMQHGVPVRGLRKAWLLYRWKRKRLIGPALAWAHELFRLGARSLHAESTEVRSACEIHRLGRHVNHAIFEAASRIESIEHEIAVLRASRKAVEDVAASNLEQLLHHGVRTDELSERFELLASSMKRNQHLLQRLNVRESRLEAEEIRRAELAPKLDALYSTFEDRFRGPESLIQERARPYLDIVRACGAGSIDAPVIDVGCGRGEWLALLRDEGLQARGIDLNTRFVAEALAQGMDVVEGDAVEMLKQMPAGCAGAVTSMHLVEHLPFERVVEFIDACAHVLRPGGLLVLETPNPENLDVATIYFYMDPTHRNPLPPIMLRWVVEARGYPDAQILRLTHERELSAPELVDETVPGAASINNLLARTHVAADYAIIAHKAGGAHG